MSTLIKRIEHHRDGRTEGPSNTNGNPTCQARGGVDVVGEEERKRDEDDKDDKLPRKQ